MHNYISLLRGINVGAQKKMKMEDLRNLYHDLGLTDVKSYVQTGNLVFRSNESPETLSAMLQAAVEEHFGFSVEIFIFNQEDWARIIAENPFTQDDGKDKKSLYVTFLSSIPDGQFVQAIDKLDFGADEYRILGSRVYLYCPNGYGRTKLNNNFWENKLKLSATTRNWNTISNLYVILKDMK